MKKMLTIAIVALLGLSAPALAQNKVDKASHGVKKGATKAWDGTKKGAGKAWHGTKKGAAKATAHIKDKESEVWIGPQGQTIYVDGTRYYWINGHGKRIYVSRAALRARNKN